MTPWELSEALDRADADGAVDPDGPARDDDAWAAASRFFAANGIDCAILVRRSTAGEVSVRSSLATEWMEAHARDMRAGREPFMRWCLPTWRSLPTGLDQLARYGFLDRSDRSAIHEAHEETGLRAGRSVILRAGGSGASAAAGWHLLTERPGAELEAQFAAHGAELALACHLIEARLRAPLPAGIDTGRRLSPRERECLQLVAAGERTASVAHRLALSESTVEFHLANARRRLGARTTAEAVAQGVSSGVIEV